VVSLTPRYALDRRLVGPQFQFGRYAEDSNPLPGTEATFSRHLAGSLDTIVTKLSSEYVLCCLSPVTVSGD
jgi:hypothetical protein